MLSYVSLHNIALIEKAELHFSSGLCAFTGETGAGKSILLSALAFVTGKTPAKGLLRVGAAEGGVVAVFTLLSDRVKDLLLESGLTADDHGELIIRRKISAEGRARAYINDAAVGAPLLKRVGEALMEIHGQHDKRGLQDPSNHRFMLDHYAGLLSDAGGVVMAYMEMRGAADKLCAAIDEREQLRREKDFLEYGVRELENLAPEPGLENDLDEKRGRLKNVERIEGIRAGIEAALYGGEEGEPGFSAVTARLSDFLRQAAQFDKNLSDCEARFREKILDAEAAAEEALSALGADSDSGESLEHIEDRLYALRLAGRKYNVAPDALSDHLEELREKLARAQGDADEEKELRKKADLAAARYMEKAQALHNKRVAAGEKLGKALTAELRMLHMPHAEAFVSVEKIPMEQCNRHGISRVEFMLRSNPGMPPGNLASIASGGELSRCMLAFKAILSEEEGGVGSMIFDEIDSGVSGATSEAVGARLKALGKKAQIFVVTHQPQVAAAADSQFLVTKKSDGNATTTHVERLSDESRVSEISRLFSGAVIGQEAATMAKKLLADARS